MERKKITLPLTRELARTLHAGDQVLLTGTIYTSRDAGHKRLRNEGFMAEIIGQTNNGNDRLLYSGGSARYLERPAEDELYQLLKE